MFSDPEKNIQQFELSDGMTVADLGAGVGFYSFPAAKAVRGGKVFAVEVQKDLLTKIKQEANKRQIRNIEIIWGDVEKLGGTKIREHIIDAVIVANILFQIEDKKSFFEELDRILKPKGKVLFVDWIDSFGGLGPQPEYIISQEKAKSLFKEKGFMLDKNINAGAH